MSGKNLSPSTGWEFGQYTNGVWTEWSARITSPFIPIYPNVQYTFTIEQDLAWINFNYFDENKTWLGSRNENGDPSFNGNRTYTTTITNGNARYIRLTARSYADSSADISGYDIANAKPQLEIGSTATAYEPYKTYNYPLDSSLTLRGIPKLDSANNLYYDGDTYESDGKVTRKYGVITYDGSTDEAWRINSVGSPTFYIENSYLKKVADYRGEIICDKLVTTQSHRYMTGDYIISGYNDLNNQYPNQNWIYIQVNSSITDISALKTWLQSNPITITYELATPTTETAEPYAEYQHVTNGGTEEYVSTGIVPVGHVTKYLTDIVSKVDGLPSDFSTLIAPTEKGFTATRKYTVNDLLIVNNILYKVTASIASGATITPNTNVQQTTLSALIKALS